MPHRLTAHLTRSRVTTNLPEAALDFLCVGLNHETSPLEIRDALVMNEAEAQVEEEVEVELGGAPITAPTVLTA